MEKRLIKLDGMSDTDAMEIVGTGDRNLKALSQAFACEISFRDNAFLIQECDEETYKRIKNVLHALYEQIQRKKRIAEQDVVYASRLALRDEEIRFEELDEVIVGRTMSGKPVVPRTHGQKAFVDAMNENSIVFAIGPAGTGKTYLAVVKAVSAFKTFAAYENRTEAVLINIFVECALICEHIVVEAPAVYRRISLCRAVH